jgi:hypothetical protein
MKSVVRTIVALGLLAGMTVGGAAQGLDPTGVWRPDANSQYEFSFCGADNTRLCGRLVDLQGRMDKERNRQYLNKVILNGAKPNGQNRWRGSMSLFGVNGNATVTMRGSNDLLVKMCAYVVICEEYAMTRVD